MVEVLIAVISAVGASLTTVLMLPQIRRQKDIENEKGIAGSWKELYESSEVDSKRKGDLIDTLYDEIKELRVENNGLTTKNAVLELKRCDKIGCGERMPPSGL